MSTTPITNLGAITGGGDPSQDAPPAPAIPQADPATLQQAAKGGVAQAEQTPPSGSRLGRIVQAVANVANTALAGIPDKGRPSFVTGLGEGARSAQAVQANQQAIKFRNFDDQVRLAQLHNQDIKLQNDTQAQTDAHKKAELDNRALANSLGIDYDTIPSDGKTVMDHLTAQTAMNGSASVPPGTHLSGDGSTVNIPKDTQATRDGQKQMYSMLGPALGLPSLPPGAQFVPPDAMNRLTNKLHGYGSDGNPIKHDDLLGVIGAMQAQRDQLEKNGASPEQLKAIDNTLGIYKANLDALDEHKADVLDAASQRKQAEQTNQIQQRGAQQRQTNASKPQKAQDSTELNAVAFDPNYQNPDGTKGANVVMSKTEAAAKGLSHYKADAGKINTVVAGMNDVQNKLNQLADVVTDPKRMGQVQGPVAQAMIEKGLTIDMHGVSVPFGRINAALNSENAKAANQATRDYVTAVLGAHEAVTQLPRLQTFGQSNRMTEKQMDAAVNLLPQAGDDPSLAAQKMTSLQGMIDPLRKQIPHMPGAESTPSWLEKRQQQQRQTPSGGSNLGRSVMGNPNQLLNDLGINNK
jgi:hypothetical protein